MYPPAKGNYATYVSYLRVQLGKVGVNVELGKEATADAVRSFEADKVILATGGRPKIPARLTITCGRRAQVARC